MTTRREIILQKYVETLSNVNAYIDTNKCVFLPKVEDINISHFVVVLTYSFTQNDEKNFIILKDLLKLYGVEISDDDYQPVFETINEFIKFVLSMK